MTIEQRPDDAAAEHSRKCLMMRFGSPMGDDFIGSVGITFDLQSFLIFYPAAETDSVWRKGFLERFFLTHAFIIAQIFS
jgi:hypothetical protein